jgi:large subunit ribosomal protein L13
MTRTTLIKPAKIIRKKYRIDASRYVLGRLASTIALHLQGKNRVEYTTGVDCGDYVYVLNASQVKITGNKLTQKKYYRFSGFPGGLTAKTLKEVMANKPEWAITQAVAGMLPKNKLKKIQLRRLKFLKDNESSLKFDADI